MERKEYNPDLLDLMIQPAFMVKDGVIVRVNEAAQKYFIQPQTKIAELLRTGKGEYQDFQTGCLYLTLSLAEVPCGASVRRMDGYDIFTLEQDADQSELQAMALAAQELRLPLSNVMAVADQLFPIAQDSDNPVAKEKTAQINRGLFQMLRVVSNMADAYRYSTQSEPKLSVCNITGLMAEIFEQSAMLLQFGNTLLTFENLNRTIFGLADREMLERAVHNIISNAVKFAPKGSAVKAKLSCRGSMLYLTVEDAGSGISGEVRSNVHNRFRRSPGLEDSRFGIGLGMVMIRSAAAAHGGTVLLDHPQGCGTRLTMTLAIRQDTDRLVRTGTFTVDYAGERDHALVELSDVLPSKAYETQKIN